MSKDQIQSPYVVVLGGNRVRKKPSTPPPDASPTHQGDPLKPEAKVFGVLQPDHAPKSMKTMTADLHTVEEHAKLSDSGEQKKKKSFGWKFFAEKTKTQSTTLDQSVTSVKTHKGRTHWWSFAKKAALQFQNIDAVKPITPNTPPMREMPPQVVRAKVIEVPSEQDHEKTSPYRSRFMRQIGKKWYLGSKLAIELPLHAKIGAGIAVLALLVVPPLVSRLSPSTPPKTAGAIVAIGTEALVAQVGKSIALPEGETPLVAVATADDVRRLNVTDAKPGNKILLYQKAGKIVVYDAETDKVLGVVNRAQP